MSDPNAGTNYQALYTKAPAALANNITYLAIPTPSQAQAVAQVAALTRQVNAVIRILLAIMDVVDGT